MLLNTNDQLLFIYKDIDICLTYKHLKSHLPPFTDHHGDGQRTMFIQAYNKVVGEEIYHKQNDDCFTPYILKIEIHNTLKYQW